MVYSEFQASERYIARLCPTKRSCLLSIQEPWVPSHGILSNHLELDSFPCLLWAGVGKQNCFTKSLERVTKDLALEAPSMCY